MMLESNLTESADFDFYDYSDRNIKPSAYITHDYNRLVTFAGKLLKRYSIRKDGADIIHEIYIHMCKMERGGIWGPLYATKHAVSKRELQSAAEQVEASEVVTDVEMDTMLAEEDLFSELVPDTKQEGDSQLEPLESHDSIEVIDESSGLIRSYVYGTVKLYILMELKSQQKSIPWDFSREYTGISDTRFETGISGMDASKVSEVIELRERLESGLERFHACMTDLGIDVCWLTGYYLDLVSAKQKDAKLQLRNLIAKCISANGVTRAEFEKLRSIVMDVLRARAELDTYASYTSSVEAAEVAE